jgi:hypothetical protein
MSPEAILKTAWGAGLRVRPSDKGGLHVTPVTALTPELRDLLTAHKPELLAFLHEARQTTAELLGAAMAACDHHGDGPEAREAMRRDVLATPEHLRADLLDHFRKTYGGQQ